MQKFRAFCKRHKCIEEVFQITYLGGNDIKVEAECLSGYVGSDFILMQSTGIKDKNGVEIYEGDIVETVYNGEVFAGVVVYDLSEVDFKVTDGKEKYGRNFQYLAGNDENEVLGNIYENPELLEGNR